MKHIDLESWARASHYQLFRGMANPHLGLTVQVDASAVMETLKPEGLPVFNLCLFAIMRAANRVEALRQRFRGDTVIQHDRVDASFTVPIADECFAFCEVDFTDQWRPFNRACQQVIDQAKQQTVLSENVEEGDDRYIYLSCLPWVHFTAMQNPFDGPEDCIPRIIWGQLRREAAGWRMPVCVEAHHALVDGLHLGRFFQYLEEEIASLQNRKMQEYDLSGDKQLSLEEFSTLWTDFTRTHMVDRFQMLDDNGDGQVSEAELAAPFQMIMTHLDRNDDGQITKDEMRRLKKHRHHRWHDRDDEDDDDE